MRQHIGADHDAALDLGAEAFGAALAVHLGQVFVLRRAMAETHAVEAAQVGAGLGGGDDVVGRNGEFGQRQRDVHQGGAQALDRLEGVAHGGFDIGGQARAEVLARQADAQAFERLRGGGAGQGLIERGDIVGHGALHAGGVARVEAGHRGEQGGAVPRGLRHRAGLVEAGGEGDHAVARAQAVGRFDAGDAAHGRRLADRAAGVGASGGGDEPCGHRRGRAAAGAAGNGGQVPRIAHRAVSRVFVGRAHGELIHIGLADRDHARACKVVSARAQTGDHGGVERADITGQHARTGGGWEGAGDEHVFVRQWHAQ